MRAPRPAVPSIHALLAPVQPAPDYVSHLFGYLLIMSLATLLPARLVASALIAACAVFSTAATVEEDTDRYLKVV